jgi:hypothetical protein
VAGRLLDRRLVEHVQPPLEPHHRAGVDLGARPTAASDTAHELPGEVKTDEKHRLDRPTGQAPRAVQRDRDREDTRSRHAAFRAR